MRESLFRACFARLSKVVVFCGTFGCTSKGYVVRESFSGLALLASQKWWFSVALLGAPVKGNVVRETSLALLEREGVAFQGLLCLPIKSGGFLWHFWVHQ